MRFGSWRGVVLILVGVSIMVGLREPAVTAQSGAAPPTVSIRRNTALNFAVWPGDFNGDGIVDLAGNDRFVSSGALALVAIGRGDGTFGAPIRTGCACPVLGVGDFDGNGNADLLVASWAFAGPVRVLPGNGDGTFGAARPVAEPASFLQAGLVADVDGDGNLDVVLLAGDEADGQVIVVPGNGDLTFGAAAVITAPTAPFGGAVADLNADGKKDIVVANHDGRSISIFLNQGSFTFAPADMPLDRQANDIAAADLNGDGRMDLIVATSSDADDDRFYVDGYAYVLLGNGNGTFQQPAKYQTPRGAWRIVLGDFNRDGTRDVATANRSAIVAEDLCGNLWDTVTILPGKTDGTFGAASSFALGDQRSPTNSRFHNGVRSLSGADVNRDGHTDLVASWGAIVINNAPDPNWAPTVTASSTQPDPETRSITLMASANDVDQDMLTYAWSDSGGGSIAPVPNPCYTPDTSGVHTFTVTVNDGHGHTASSSVTVDFGGSTGVYRPPSATIAAPPSGEVLLASRPYTIRWTVTPGSHQVTRINVRFWWETSPPAPIAECSDLPASATSCVWNSPAPLSDTAHVSVDMLDSSGRANGVTSQQFSIRESEPSGGTLPEGWSHADVGQVAASGTATFDGHVYEGHGLTVAGSGADIWGTEDAFHYVWKAFSGNFDINARVDSLENVRAWTKAGIMIRATAMNSASRHASILVSPSNGIAFQRRVNDFDTSVSTAGPALTAPVWLRMVRVGTVLRAYYRKVSTDTWTLLGQQEMTGLPTSVDVGVAVSSHADGTRATARFQGVYLASLPDFVGTAVGEATGSWTSDGTNYTVKGAGRDIWGTSDSFFFLAVPLGTNDSITARVRTIGNTDPWAKAGVMIRESLAADSKHADAIVSPGKGFAMQYRNATGAASASAVQMAGAAPIWLRIRRSENASSPTLPDILETSYSTDRLIWRTLGSVSFNTTHDGYIGIAVTSHKEGTETTAVIDDVRVER